MLRDYTVCCQTFINLGFYSSVFKAVNSWSQLSVENLHNTYSWSLTDFGWWICFIKKNGVFFTWQLLQSKDSNNSAVHCWQAHIVCQFMLLICHWNFLYLRIMCKSLHPPEKQVLECVWRNLLEVDLSPFMLKGISTVIPLVPQWSPTSSRELMNVLSKYRRLLNSLCPSDGDYSLKRRQSIIKYVMPVLLLPSSFFSQSENFCIYRRSWLLNHQHYSCWGQQLVTSLK